MVDLWNLKNFLIKRRVPSFLNNFLKEINKRPMRIKIPKLILVNLIKILKKILIIIFNDQFFLIKIKVTL